MSVNGNILNIFGGAVALRPSSRRLLFHRTFHSSLAESYLTLFFSDIFLCSKIDNFLRKPGQRQYSEDNERGVSAILFQFVITASHSYGPN